MRLELEIQIQGLRCLKGIFTRLQKCLFSHKQTPTIFLIYFLESRQIRFLIDSEQCKTIVAVHPQLIIKNESSHKEDVQLLSLEFKSSKEFLKFYDILIEREGGGQAIFTLNKEKAQYSEEPFRCLTMSFSNVKLKCEIQKPLYDTENIVHHQWLNGCIPEDRKVQFDINSEHVLIFLKMASKLKEFKCQEKIVLMELNFETSRILLSFQRLKHSSRALITYQDFKSPQYKGNYSFEIKVEDTKKLYEFILQKSPGSRMYINKKNEIVLAHFQQGTFESQVILKTWITFTSFQGLGGHGGIKMQI